MPMIKIPSQFRLTLFWKILVWFWLSIIVIVTLNLFFSFVYNNKAHIENLPERAKKDLILTAKKASHAFNHYKSKRRLSIQLKQYYFLNENGKPFFRRKPPPLLVKLHENVLTTNQSQMIRKGPEYFWGGIQVNYRKEKLWLYAGHKPPGFSRHLVGNFFRDFTKNLFITIFLVSFPLSFLLSWLITKPIQKLQQATNHLKQDLSNRKALSKLLIRRDEFGDLAKDFDQLAQHLANKIDAQKQLISDVSHELRSPLTRLKIAIGMIDNQSSNSPKMAEKLRQEANRMNEMLERLLSLSKLENTQDNQTQESINLSQLFNLIIDECEFEAEQKQIAINANISPEMMIKGNQESLYSGIENILRNAIKYTPENGKIECNLNSNQTLVELSIRDNGAGVEPSMIEDIFKPFFRPQDDRSRQSGGVGLGLSIAERAIKLNRGNIKAENVEPHGLKVTITLPQISRT